MKTDISCIFVGLAGISLIVYAIAFYNVAIETEEIVLTFLFSLIAGIGVASIAVKKLDL